MKIYCIHCTKKLGHCITFTEYIYNLNLYRNNNKTKKYLQYMQIRKEFMNFTRILSMMMLKKYISLKLAACQRLKQEDSMDWPLQHCSSV
jgi:hypothetical protein